MRCCCDDDAVPLRVGLVVFVSLVFDHPVAADPDVRPGHLHSVQSDPGTQRPLFRGSYGHGGGRGKGAGDSAFILISIHVS